jgi:hypothetical protein
MLYVGDCTRKLGFLAWIVSVAATSGCKLTLTRDLSSAISTPLGTSGSPVSVSFTTPSSGAWINAATDQAVTLSGSCSEPGQSVVLGGSASGSPSCLSGSWSQVVDLSAHSDGALAIHVHHENTDGTRSAQSTLELNKDTAHPNAPSFSAPTAPLTLGSSSYAFAWSTTDNGPSGLATSATYLVERFANGTCSGGASSSSSQTSAFYVYSSLADGSVYSVRVSAVDAAGNAGASTCSNALTIDLDAPTFALSDGTTSSTAHVRQAAASVSIGNDAAAVKWCLSETQTSAPANGSATCAGGAGPSNGWYTSRPTNINLSAGEGTKTAYLWIADATDLVYVASVTDAITRDETLPAAPSVAISDPNTSSANYTNQSSITLGITSDTDATAWCAIEQAAATADPSAPAWNAGCWVTTRPTTATLTATGSRKVFVFTKDVAHNISAASGSAAIDYSTTAPGNPTLALSDGGSANSGYAWQTAINATIGNDATAAKWCLSESQSTKPALGTSSCTGGTGWVAIEPTAFSLSSGDAAKTVYVWVADQYNNVNASAVSATITLDTTNPTAFAISGISDASGDSIADAHLTHSFNPTVIWTDSTGENAFDVRIFESDGTTIKCALVSKAADVLTHAFSTCNLDDQTNYIADIGARKLSGRALSATNSPYTFRVQPALYFTQGSQSLNESAGSATATATLSRTTTLSVTATITVTGSASNPSDHDLSGGALTINSGSLTSASSIKTANIVNDANYEAPKTIVLTLSGATNAGLIAGNPLQH